MMSSDKATVIIAAKAGRLGNRLFQGAHFIGNALSKGYRLLNPSLGEYAHLFEGSSRDPLCAYPENWGDEEPEFASQYRDVLYKGTHLLGLIVATGLVPAMSTIDIRRFDENDQGEVDLNGSVFGELLQSKKLIFPMGWKFCDHIVLTQYRAQILRYFTPVESVRQPAERIVEHARERADLLVGVHIRQADYRTWKNGIHFYETERYVQWMRDILDSNPLKRVAFLICASNHLDESLFSRVPFVKGPGFPAGDLHALSLCDKIIGPPSTFSGWASYYGGVPLCVLRDSNASVLA